MEVTQGAGKSYVKHLTPENLDAWVGRRGIRPLLATNLDMYRAGHMSMGTTEPPLSTQQLLQPHSQFHGNRSNSVNMQEAVMCQPPSGYFNSSTNPRVMSRPKELGMPEERPKFQDVDTKRKWTPAGSEGLDRSQLWLKREQDPQMVPKLSPALLEAPKSTNPRSTPSKTYMPRLFQEISRAEVLSTQWSDIHDITQVRLDLLDRHVLASAGPGETAAFMHDRNASTSPSEHAVSEDRASSLELRQTSPGVELKRTGSISSEDFLDTDPAQGGRGRSVPRNSNNNTVSKNLVSERKRRKKLNDGLYSLRALVPKISKMDKASIVGDAIEHVKELQQQIDSIESEIAEMESRVSANSVAEDSGVSVLSESAEHAVIDVSGICKVVEAASELVGEVAANANTISSVASTADMISVADPQSQFLVLDQKKILKMDVAKLEEQTYQLQISCQKGPGVLVQLTQALESLDLDVLNAYHTSFQESILNTFIVEMKNLDNEEAKDVRSTLLDAVARHGLVQF